MTIHITRVVGAKYARLNKPALLMIPPSALVHLLKGATGGSPDGLPHGLYRDVSNGENGVTISSVAMFGGEFSTSPFAGNGERSPEYDLCWAILEQLINDLSLSGRRFIHAPEIPTLLEAIEHVENGSLWFCDVIDLDPDYVRRKLRAFGYLPTIKVRKVNRRRSARWNLADFVTREYLADENRYGQQFRARHHLERLPSNQKTPEVYSNGF